MRLEQITFTRFLAAIAIVVYHYGRDIFPFNNGAIAFIFERANVGVSYFFILSGFVMIIAYGDKSEINTFEYLKSRFARIYPVYLLALLAMVIYYIGIEEPIDYKGLLLNLFTLQAWVPGKAMSVNSPGWSLAVEFFFYISFPFLFNSIYKKTEFKNLVFPVIAFWAFSQFIFNLAVTSDFYQGFPSMSYDLLYFFPLMHLNEFLIGNLAGLFFIKIIKGKNRNYDWIILIISLAILFTLKNPLCFNLHNGLLAVLFVPFIIFVSLNNGLLAAISNLKLFTFLGEISYGIYILQVPVFILAGILFTRLHIDDKLVKFYLSVVILLFTSGISYVFIEAPLRKRIKSIRLK
jgi:peptidoglycan/LPS O-acetylase OafA/YrhL